MTIQQRKMHDSLRLVMGLKNLSTTLLDTLTKTIDACDSFQKISLPGYLDVPDASHQNRLLYALPATYRELRVLRNELESSVKRVEEFAGQVSVFL